MVNSKIEAEVVAEDILVLIGRKVDYMDRWIERDELTEDDRLYGNERRRHWQKRGLLFLLKIQQI